MDIPPDLLQEIFIRLPCKDVVVSKCVCRSWYNLLSHPDFTANYTINSPFTALFSEHLNPKSFSLLQLGQNGGLIRTPINPKLPGYPAEKLDSNNSDLQFIGTRNGLLSLLLRIRSRNRTIEKIYFFDPIFDECFEIAENNVAVEEFGYEYMVGYVPEIETYKILRFVYDDNQQVLRAKILSVGVDQEWRILDDPFTFLFPSSNGVSFKGFHHWVSTNPNLDRICTFDLLDEKCSGIPKPRELKQLSHEKMNLRVLNNDRLSLIDVSVWGEISIWTMEEYGVADSWSKNVISCFSINGFPWELRRSDYHIITAFPNGDILLSQKGGTTFFYISSERKQSTKVEIPDKSSSMTNATAFVPRFYRIKEDSTSGVLHRTRNRNLLSSRIDVSTLPSRLKLSFKRLLGFV
ncbi:hypothetical protein ACP275_01G055400 [Erythranthe tilingii]